MIRAQLLRVIADAKREAAKMRRMFPHSYRWAVASLPTLPKEPRHD